MFPSRTDLGPRVVVRVRPSAFYAMLFAAVESAVVAPEMSAASLNFLTAWDRSRKGKRVHASPLPPSLIFSQTGLETAGVLAGRQEMEGENTVYVVEHMYSVSACRSDGWVGHSCRSPELLDELAAAMDAPWEVIGGFHSHSLMDAEVGEIERERRFMPSACDWERRLLFWGHEIDLIVSVTKAGAATPAPLPQPGPLAQFRIGEFEFWVVAYKGNKDAVVLKVEGPTDRPETRPGNWQRRPPPPF